MSKIFRERLHGLCDARGHVLIGPLHAGFMARRAEKCADYINGKFLSFHHCIGFMDGTVIGIARPGNSTEQNVAYNRHKRKYAIKVQIITSPDGLILHAHGSIEGRRHDWALYVRRDIEEQLEVVFTVGDVQFYVHAYSGNNRRRTVDAPF